MGNIGPADVWVRPTSPCSCGIGTRVEGSRQDFNHPPANKIIPASIASQDPTSPPPDSFPVEPYSQQCQSPRAPGKSHPGSTKESSLHSSISPISIRHTPAPNPTVLIQIRNFRRRMLPVQRPRILHLDQYVPAPQLFDLFIRHVLARSDQPMAIFPSVRN